MTDERCLSPRSLHAALFLVLLLWAGAASACDNDDTDGLDVALVLSGGGALVTTQIGALAEIEALGIPIHCVVGSSMGSVVGALYAAGYDAEALKSAFRDDDWGAIFRGGTDRRQEAYLRKEQDDLYFSGYFAGIGENGVTLPRGFGDMSGLQAHFRQLTRHVSSDSNFDALRVPYRAIAMNLTTGDAVAFDQGDLVEAMLASMAVPGVFPPRQIDGVSYVDGGMASQLPVKTAFAMGADIIIALDTTIRPPKLGPNASIAEVTQQLIRLTVWRNWQAETALLRDGDVLMQPSLDGLTTSSFQRAEQGFASGAAEALRYRAQLQAIKARAAPSKDRVLDRTPIVPASEQLIVANGSKVNDSMIRKRLGYRPEQLEDSRALNHRLRDLASFGAFGKVDLRVTEQESYLNVEPLSLGRNLLQAGFRTSNNLAGDSTFGVLGQLSRRPFGLRGGELRVAGEVGTDLGLSGEWYVPFGDEGRFFYTPGMSYRAEQVLLDIGDVRLAEFQQQSLSVSLRAGRELGQWGVIAAESLVTKGRISPELSIDPEVFRTTEYEQAGAGILLGLDTLDRASWPSSGAQMRMRLQRLYDLDTNAETDKYSIDVMKPYARGSLGMALRVAAEGVLNEDNEPVQILTLGGFRRLSAFAENSVPTNEYVLASVEVYKRLTATNRVVNFPVYFGGTLEYADLKLDIFEEGANENGLNGSVYLGADTVIGPFFLGVGLGDSGDTSFFLHFGRGF